MTERLTKKQKAEIIAKCDKIKQEISFVEKVGFMTDTAKERRARELEHVIMGISETLWILGYELEDVMTVDMDYKGPWHAISLREVTC